MRKKYIEAVVDQMFDNDYIRVSEDHSIPVTLESRDHFIKALGQHYFDTVGRVDGNNLNDAANALRPVLAPLVNACLDPTTFADACVHSLAVVWESTNTFAIDLAAMLLDTLPIDPMQLETRPISKMPPTVLALIDAFRDRDRFYRATNADDQPLNALYRSQPVHPHGRFLNTLIKLLSHVYDYEPGIDPRKMPWNNLPGYNGVQVTASPLTRGQVASLVRFLPAYGAQDYNALWQQFGSVPRSRRLEICAGLRVDLIENRLVPTLEQLLGAVDIYLPEIGEYQAVLRVMWQPADGSSTGILGEHATVLTFLPETEGFTSGVFCGSTATQPYVVCTPDGRKHYCQTASGYYGPNAAHPTARDINYSSQWPLLGVYLVRKA